MAILTVTNLQSVADLYLSDLYATIPAGKSVATTRAASDLPRMFSLQAAMAAGTASLSVAYSADEIASGLMAPPNAISGDDFAAVASTAVLSGDSLIRKACVSVAGGTADDQVIYVANTLPFKMRVVDAWAFVSAAGAGTWTVNDQAAGAGQVMATLDSTATGRAGDTAPNATLVATPGALIGLFVHRTNKTTAGEVFIRVRRES